MAIESAIRSYVTCSQEEKNLIPVGTKYNPQSTVTVLDREKQNSTAIAIISAIGFLISLLITAIAPGPALIVFTALMGTSALASTFYLAHLFEMNDFENPEERQDHAYRLATQPLSTLAEKYNPKTVRDYALLGDGNKSIYVIYEKCFEYYRTIQKESYHDQTVREQTLDQVFSEYRTQLNSMPA